MTAKQMLAACRTIADLGFSNEELIGYVKEGQDVAGDGSGKIKMNEFASYLAFEAKKKFKKTAPSADAPSTATNGHSDYLNPFADLDFLSGDTASGPPQPSPHKLPSTGSATKITITPDPHHSSVGNLSNTSNLSMAGSYSPTQSDPTDLPKWFGHSLETITNHPEQPSTVFDDNPFGFLDDDDQKQSAPQPLKLMNVNTNDLIFTESAPSSPKSGVSQKPNLSPKKAKNLKKSRHQATRSAMGLLPAPRSKGDPVTRPKSKKKKSRKGVHGQHAMSASFNNLFAVGIEDLGLDGLKNVDIEALKEPPESVPTERARIKLTKSQSERSFPAAPKTKAPAAGAAPKRPKIDAVVEMKRGAAMLKYGRRGFPHFRRFQVSQDLTKLLWYSRKKSLGETHVAVRDMKDILSGQQTEVFKQCTQKTLEKASFSIIYGSKMKTLDVVAKSAEEAELWIKGLKGLIKANSQGKLHKVVQILVDVDFKDISKTKYRTASDDERRKHELQHKQRPELVHTIEQTLQQSRKIFVSLTKLSKLNNVRNSSEYENIQTLTSEIEERLEEIEYGMQNKTADLQDVKRDVWVLKVDVTVMEEKVKVLSKIKTRALPI